MLNTYAKMIPLWMKEDEQFSKVYKYIEDVFNQVIKTCEDMKSNIEFNINSKAFLKVLSIFGQEEVFRGTGKKVIGLKWDGLKWIVLREDTEDDINIVLSEFSLFFSAKFNSLKNNFNGTFKSLKESLSNVFKQDTTKGDYITIKGFQDIREDDYNNKHPFVILNLDLAQALQNALPPQTSGVDGAYDDPNYIGYIEHIRPEWLSQSEGNQVLYNNLKDYLELLTLFENNYFKLNILGVLTIFEVTGNALILRWNKGLWNEAQWSDNYVQEEE